MPVQLLTGATWRTDFIDDFQALTVDRQVDPAFTALKGKGLQMNTTETNLAGFAQLQVKPVSWLKLTPAPASINSTTTSATAKTRVVFRRQANSISPLLSWNRRRGSRSRLSPGLRFMRIIGQDSAAPMPFPELVQAGLQSLQPFKIESKEVGGKIQAGRFALQAAFYTTDAQNEAYVLPDGTSTLIGQTRRDGYDLDARYAIVKDRSSEVALFGNYSAVNAFRLDAARDPVWNVPVYTANLGVDFNLAMGCGERILGQAYVGFIGKKYLSDVSDGQLTSSPYQRLSAKVGYAWPSGWSAFTQATWYPGNRDSEFEINFSDPGLRRRSARRRCRSSQCWLGSLTGRPHRGWQWTRT